jgi:hypothetical protein
MTIQRVTRKKKIDASYELFSLDTAFPAFCIPDLHGIVDEHGRRSMQVNVCGCWCVLCLAATLQVNMGGYRHVQKVAMR